MRTKRDKQPIRLSYIFCVAGMMFLIMISLFLPQLLFAIQDTYRMSNTLVEVRSNVDIAEWNASYEQNLNTRLNNLLNMQGITVTAIDYEATNDSEIGELLENVFYQGWFAPLYDNEIMSTYVLTGDFKESFPLTVQEYKKYLVHGQDYQDGVALMMWYMDLYLEAADMRVRFLADTETDTIYYVKVTAGNNRKNEEYKVNKSQAGSILYFFDYYYSYYEADTDALFEQYGTYDANYPWFLDVKTKEDCEVVFPLYYGELNTDFMIRIEPGQEKYPNITMGLPMIGELIPEMLQD